MDFSPIVDGVVTAFPAVSPYLAVIPLVNVLATGLERITRRSHSTWLNTVFWYASVFPRINPFPPPPVTERR